MSDIFDRAQEQAEMLLRNALEAQRLRAAKTAGLAGDPSQWRVLSAEECTGSRCGAPIPDGRREALPGVQLCVDCQAAMERRA